MKGKWMRRIAALGSVMSMSLLWGCAGQTPSQTTPVWTPLPEETQVQMTAVTFPVMLPDSALIAEKLISYRGPYWEDGTGDQVENVAGLMLCNPTNRMVDFAAFVLEQASQSLYFFVYRMPPESRCLVLEHNRKNWQQADVTDCRELRVRWTYQEMSREQLDYLGFGPQLTVINRDCRTQNHVTVWYKQYVKEGEYYLGGAAQSAHLFFLEPQEHRTITPEGYNAGNARIVSIRLEP